MTPLLEERLFLVRASKGEGGRGRADSTTVGQLEGLPIILPTAGHGLHSVLDAAVAVGKLRRLTRARMRELLSIAATMGMATSRNTLLEGATVRNTYAGHSGLMGQMAVRLVLAGFTGEADGVRSIYGVVLSDTFDPDRVVAGLGSDWLIEQGYFKLHCVGRYVHSAIDALEDALSKVPGRRLSAERIDRIDVTAYRLAASLNGKNITTSFGARFSIPFALATILHHGRSDLSAFDDDAVANPEVQNLVARIFVREEARYNDVYPSRQLCDVEIALNDGTSVAGHCIVTKGERSNPHRPEELEAKFFGLGRPIGGESVTRRLHDAFMDLDRIEDFRAFSSGLRL